MLPCFAGRQEFSTKVNAQCTVFTHFNDHVPSCKKIPFTKPNRFQEKDERVTVGPILDLLAQIS